MINSINFRSVDQASLTVLVDNKADLIVKSTTRVKYFTEGPLLAEHGFSVLIQVENPNIVLESPYLGKQLIVINPMQVFSVG